MTVVADQRRCSAQHEQEHRDGHRQLHSEDPNSTGAPVGYGQHVASTKKLFAALKRRGPHRVLRGDLSFAGLPGVVYTPESGFNLPGIAFAHEWLTGVERYAGTLEHLASWGIVAAAPDTEKGIAPSVLNLAFDLGTALDIIAGVRLGDGKISVHPHKLGLVGHGFGASTAVFAAAGMPAKPKAVVAAFPTVTKPAAQEAAATLQVPGLILTDPGDPMSLRSNAIELARAWKTATLRAMPKAKAGGLIEGRRLARVVGLPGADKDTQKLVRALTTGYLLHMLTGDKAFRDFADPEVDLPKAAVMDPFAGEPVDLENKVVALLKP
jgi:dienelactone hydrolase